MYANAHLFTHTNKHAHTHTHKLVGTPLPEQEELPLEKLNLCQQCWLFSTLFRSRLNKHLHAVVIFRSTIAGHEGSASTCMHNEMITER